MYKNNLCTIVEEVLIHHYGLVYFKLIFVLISAVKLMQFSFLIDFFKCDPPLLYQ